MLDAVGAFCPPQAPLGRILLMIGPKNERSGRAVFGGGFSVIGKRGFPATDLPGFAESWLRRAENGLSTRELGEETVWHNGARIESSRFRQGCQSSRSRKTKLQFESKGRRDNAYVSRDVIEKKGG